MVKRTVKKGLFAKLVTTLLQDEKRTCFFYVKGAISVDTQGLQRKEPTNAVGSFLRFFSQSKDNHFSENLRDLIGGGSVYGFSRKVGLSEANIRTYLNGTNPQLDRLLKISQACNVTLDWLAKNEGFKDKNDLDNAAAKAYLQGFSGDLNVGELAKILSTLPDKEKVFAEILEFARARAKTYAIEKELQEVKETLKKLQKT